MVLPDGEIVSLGGKHMDSEGYDLLGLMTGSEGLLGIITEVTVRILSRPTSANALMIGFDSSEQAGKCVANIIADGIIPGGMEMMDGPAIEAAEAFVKVGYPLNVGALLLVELDGPFEEVNFLIDRVKEIANSQGAVSIALGNHEDAIGHLNKVSIKGEGQMKNWKKVKPKAQAKV